MISGTSLTEASRWQGVEISLMRSVMAKAPANAVNLALGELGYPLPQSLRDHAMELLASGTPVYTPNAGIPELRESIASTYGGATNPGCVCVCNGAQEALFLSLFSIIETGDKVAVPDPDYSAYCSILSILGANIIRLPLKRQLKSIDWDRWRNLLQDGVKVILLSSPNNPCGYYLKETDTNALASICADFGITVAIDEIYKGLCFAGTPASLTGKVEKLFIINGLSKSHCMTGWRLGWVVAPEPLVATLTKAKQYVSTCSGWLSQQLAVFALGKIGRNAADKVFLQLLNSRGAALTILGSACPSSCLHVPDATPYLMLRCDDNDLHVAEKLAAKGVIVAPGSAFGKLSAGMIRINYGVEVGMLEKGLKVIVDELYPH